MAEATEAAVGVTTSVAAGPALRGARHVEDAQFLRRRAGSSRRGGAHGRRCQRRWWRWWRWWRRRQRRSGRRRRRRRGRHRRGQHARARVVLSATEAEATEAAVGVTARVAAKPALRGARLIQDTQLLRVRRAGRCRRGGARHGVINHRRRARRVFILRTRVVDDACITREATEAAVRTSATGVAAVAQRVVGVVRVDASRVVVAVFDSASRACGGDDVRAGGRHRR